MVLIIHLNCVNALINLYLHLSTTYPLCVVFSDVQTYLPVYHESQIIKEEKKNSLFVAPERKAFNDYPFAYFNIHTTYSCYDTRQYGKFEL